MGRDGDWPGIQLSTGVNAGADGIIYIVTPKRFEYLSFAPRRARCVSLSPPFLSYSIYRLSPAPILTTSPPHLCFRLLPLLPTTALPRTVCLSCSSTTEFPFYALVKYFPWFYVLLFVRILLSGFSSCQRHFLALRYILRIVSFITGISDFSAVFLIASFPFVFGERLGTYKNKKIKKNETDRILGCIATRAVLRKLVR